MWCVLARVLGSGEFRVPRDFSIFRFFVRVCAVLFILHLWSTIYHLAPCASAFSIFISPAARRRAHEFSLFTALYSLRYSPPRNMIDLD